MTVLSETRWGLPDTAVRDRRAADPRVNLSSNELHHPQVESLAREMVDGFDPAVLRAYPVQEPAAAAAGALLGLPAHHLLLSAGSDAVIRLLLTSLRGAFPGGLVLQEPNYEAWTQAVDAPLWPLRKVTSTDGTATTSAEAMLDAAADAEPALVVVSWPNGPAGYTPRLDHIAELSAVCRSRGHLLIVDGCYAGFAGSPLKVAELADDHCLVLLSWSKMFGFAGGRLAVACGGPDLVHRLRAARQEDHVSALALHALTRTGQVYDRFTHVWQDITATREAMRSRLTALGHHVPESGGNFLHVPRPTAASAAELTARLSHSGYRVRDMGLTSGLHHHVRFTVAHGPAGEQFLDCLVRHLAEVGGA
ncbi:aminotransferase class I/II-fold pyridoxal phosphate-dependent enzyme (plasmid) [Streptomyces sp. HUAS MG91]|uniref:histidinol-phosphate transaminase n=1 Tax=Streptomyces tabacisoli TaxID=3156398 RepID=A0AAU8J6A5_9ACTN